MEPLSSAKPFRRRWTQFSLRFLFVAVLAVAIAAWWFRPGVVDPKFSLEGFTSETEDGTERIRAQIRLTNTGPDAIWLDHASTYFWRPGVPDVRTLSVNEVETDAFVLVYHIRMYGTSRKRVGLEPGESIVFTGQLEEHERTIQIGVPLSDHHKSREREYWSEVFVVPENARVVGNH